MNTKARKLQKKLDHELAWSRVYRARGLDRNWILSEARVVELKRQLAKLGE
jgi:hypothetical protein